MIETPASQNRYTLRLNVSQLLTIVFYLHITKHELLMAGGSSFYVSLHQVSLGHAFSYELSDF